MKKGFALITVLAVLIMIALGTATVLQSVGSQTNMKSSNLQETKAQFLAEAGMQYALYICRTSGGSCAGFTTPAIHTIDGTNVTISATAPGVAGNYIIKVDTPEYSMAL
jgi:Tfp pilus assembly protein PilX